MSKYDQDLEELLAVGERLLSQVRSFLANNGASVPPQPYRSSPFDPMDRGYRTVASFDWFRRYGAQRLNRAFPLLFSTVLMADQWSQTLPMAIRRGYAAQLAPLFQTAARFKSIQARIEARKIDPSYTAGSVYPYTS